MRNVRWLALLFCLLPSLLLAQAQGRIKGTVLNTKGEPIAKAKVTITCPEITTFHKEINVNGDGSFATLIVDATKLYVFQVDAEGYQSVKETYKPRIGGETLELSFTLKSVNEVDLQSEAQFYEQPGIKELLEGQELAEAGKLAEARAKYEEALAARSDLYQAWHEIGWIDLKAGKAAEALIAAEKCLELSAKQPSCLALATNAAKEADNQEAYEKYLAAYKTANPEDPVVLYNEAAAAINSADDATAKPLLERAVEIDPEYPDALFQLGMVYLRSGDGAKCKELLGKFILVAPDHPEAATATEMLKYLE